MKLEKILLTISLVGGLIFPSCRDKRNKQETIFPDLPIVTFAEYIESPSKYFNRNLVLEFNKGEISSEKQPNGFYGNYIFLSAVEDDANGGEYGFGSIRGILPLTKYDLSKRINKKLEKIIKSSGKIFCVGTIETDPEQPGLKIEKIILKYGNGKIEPISF